MKRVHVIAGLIFSPCGQQLLLSRRPKHLHQGGLWEFPGGKLETGEAPEQALARELEEELGIEVDPHVCTAFMAVSHDYVDKHILLDTWRVPHFRGTPEGREGQEVRWVALTALDALPFPEADRPILDALLAQSGAD